MIKVAITGGIGSGKSAVCSYLEDRGYLVIYADRIAREATASGGFAIPYIIENFGNEYIKADGSMDRTKMRELVMHDKEALDKLEAGTTYEVKRIIDESVRLLEEKNVPAVFFEIPLLFEKSNGEGYDCIWFVTADYETRIKRIKARDGITREAAISIIENQLDDNIKAAKSDVIIHNDSSVVELHKEIDKNLEKLQIKACFLGDTCV